MPITTFVQLMAEAKKVGPKMVAVTVPHEPEILLAAQDAERGHRQLHSRWRPRPHQEAGHRAQDRHNKDDDHPGAGTQGGGTQGHGIAAHGPC